VSHANDKQDAIIARLDSLIAAVNQLTEALVPSGASDGPKPAVAAAVDAVAREEVSTEAVSQAPTPAPARDAAPAAGAVEVIVEDVVVSGIPGPGADMQATLSRMFQAALQGDRDASWRELTALTHPLELVAPRALDGLKAFSWKQMRKNAAKYVIDGRFDSFTVVRTDPAELSGAEDRIKVFLHADGRSPAPVTLRRDEHSGGAWRLGSISL